MTIRSIIFVVLVVATGICVADEAVKGDKIEFQTDVRKMLDIIINSLYTNRNIFLRELISNAADALDKIRFLYLTEPHTPKNAAGEDPSMDIRIRVDKLAKQLIIQDGGIGMSKDDLNNNLGSIGSSGTKRFIEKMQEGAHDMNLIGQFGVGFYSAFLVADVVRVASKSDADEKQWVWESTADGAYYVYEDPRGNTLGRGTEITLELKEDADEFLTQDKLKEVVGKYSEFIQFPIFVQTTKTEKVPVKTDDAEVDAEPASEDGEVSDSEDKPEKKEPEMEEVTTTSWDRVNEQKPIWTRKPTDLTDEDYNSFYKTITKEYEDPLTSVHFSAEGEVEFKSILYIPAKAPFNMWDAASSAVQSVRLYVRRVFITDEFKDLLPRYLNFIKGVVDSDDLPLNVSRELLQESRILKIIKKKLIRKVLSMIKDLADDDIRKVEEEKEKLEEKAKDKDGDEEEERPAPYQEKYPKFWEEFGKSIRLGVIEDSGNRARLTKLLRYKSTKSLDSYLSLEQYVDRMPENQKDIYYIIGPGETEAKMADSPMLEKAKAKGVEVLLMTDAIDEYVVGHITEFSGKKLVSLQKEDAQLPGEDGENAKKVAEKRKEANKGLTSWLKSTLGSRVEKVVVSDRLQDAPCVLVSPKYGMTANMYRIMKGTPLGESQPQAEVKKVMEINIRHPIINEMKQRIKEDQADPSAVEAALLMYETAAIQNGFPLDDLSSFVARLHRSMKTSFGLEADAPLVDEEEYVLDEPEEEEEAVDGDEAPATAGDDEL